MRKLSMMESMFALALLALPAHAQQPQAEPPIQITSMALAPDGSVLAIADGFGGIQLIDAKSGRDTGVRVACSDKLPRRSVQALAFSQDGRSLACGDARGQIFIWDVLNGGKEALGFEALPPTKSGFHAVASLTFIPEGNGLIAVGSDGSVKRWSIADGNLLQTIRPAAEGEPRPMAITRDGKFGAIVDGSNVQLWHLGWADNMRTIKDMDGVHSLAFSNDGKQLVALATKQINVRQRRTTAIVCDAQTGQRLRDFTVCESAGVSDSNTARAMAFSPSGKLLVTAETTGPLRFWDLAKGRNVQVYNAVGYHQLIASTDGVHLIGMNATALTAWNLQTGKQAWTRGR